MFRELEIINSKPKPFEQYTAASLWTDDHISKQMLAYHLNENVDASSRNKAFIDRSIRWIADTFNIDKNTKIADFGCGPGLYTTGFSEYSADITGIDFSENSLNYAKKVADEKGLDIQYIHSDYLELTPIGQFDLITLIFCDFCVLSPEQRSKLLRKFHTMLTDNGSILMDVSTLKLFDQKKECALYEKNHMSGFWSPDDYYVFANTFKYNNEKLILDKYTIFEKSRTREIFNWLQCFDIESLTEELEQHGLNICEVFSDVAGKPFDTDSNEMAVIIKKNEN